MKRPEVESALWRFYALLGLRLPPIEYAKDLLDGYTRARGSAWGVLQETGRDVARDIHWGTRRDQTRNAVWSLIWRIAEERAEERRRGEMAPGKVSIVKTDPLWWEAYKQAHTAASGAKWPLSQGTRRLPKPIPVEELTKALITARRHGLGYYLPTADRLILVPTPHVQTDTQGRLHSEEGPAVAWPDGEEFHLIHGVLYSKALWTAVISRALTISEILGLTNVEQRIHALRVQGVNTLLAHAGTKRLNRASGYELYRVSIGFGEPAYFLKYDCPSTGKTYLSGVPPIVGKRRSAISAMKWKFHLEEHRGKRLFTEEA